MITGFTFFLRAKGAGVAPRSLPGMMRIAPITRRRALASMTTGGSRSAIVTGAAQGIGRAIALRLAEDGFDVCVNDLESNAAAAESVVDEIRSTGRKSFAAYTNVSKMQQVQAMVQSSVDTLGPLNLMVANAGITKVQWLLDSTEADWRRIFEVNVHGVVNCNIAAAKQFIKQGSGGKILNAASGTSYKPLPLLSSYSASKAAVRSLTQSFAMELARHNITVNAYAPGVVNSAMWEQIDGEMGQINGLPKGENFKRTEQSITLGRTSVPEDVSKAVSFLASADSDYITGQTLVVDGGIVFS